MTVAARRQSISEPGRPDELDEITIRRAQRGERDACRALVERHQGAVFALIGRMLGPARAGSVEDVAQDTFLAVFRTLAGFSPSGAARLSTWILTIASRRAIDELRRPRLVDDADAAVLPAPDRGDDAARRGGSRRRSSAPCSRSRPSTGRPSSCASTTGSNTARSPACSTSTSAR
jgi:RNA polymerase sigma-70 factor (ECF subfamily)